MPYERTREANMVSVSQLASDRLTRRAAETERYLPILDSNTSALQKKL